MNCLGLRFTVDRLFADRRENRRVVESDRIVVALAIPVWMC
jgi:hypothetical protein